MKHSIFLFPTFFLLLCAFDVSFNLQKSHEAKLYEIYLKNNISTARQFVLVRVRKDNLDSLYRTDLGALYLTIHKWNEELDRTSNNILALSFDTINHIFNIDIKGNIDFHYPFEEYDWEINISKLVDLSQDTISICNDISIENIDNIEIKKLLQGYQVGRGCVANYPWESDTVVHELEEAKLIIKQNPYLLLD